MGRAEGVVEGNGDNCTWTTIEVFFKKEKGLMDMVNRVVISGEGCIRGLNGNGKYNKDYILEKETIKQFQIIIKL